MWRYRLGKICVVHTLYGNRFQGLREQILDLECRNTEERSEFNDNIQCLRVQIVFLASGWSLFQKLRTKEDDEGFQRASLTWETRESS